MNLACKYLGVERLCRDAVFDGQPFSLMDLEAIRKKLDARPDDRAITVICLGK